MPVAAIGNVYSTLVVASAHRDARLERADRDAEMQRRNGLRHMVVRAVLHIMQRDSVDDLTALKQLRARAMGDRTSLEDVAIAMLAESETGTARHGR